MRCGSLAGVGIAVALVGCGSGDGADVHPSYGDAKRSALAALPFRCAQLNDLELETPPHPTLADPTEARALACDRATLITYYVLANAEDVPQLAQASELQEVPRGADPNSLAHFVNDRVLIIVTNENPGSGGGQENRSIAERIRRDCGCGEVRTPKR